MEIVRIIDWHFKGTQSGYSLQVGRIHGVATEAPLFCQNCILFWRLILFQCIVLVVNPVAEFDSIDDR